MEIRNDLALRGPNIWAWFPVMEVWLNLGPWQGRSSNSIPGFADRLLSYLPQLSGQAGFARELRKGISLAVVFEHVVVELQRQAGVDSDFSRIQESSEKGVYAIVFRYREETLARAAIEQARLLILAAAEDRGYEISNAVERLRQIAVQNIPPAGAEAIRRAAESRDIPCIQLDKTGLLQLGQGANQRRIRSGESDRTGAIAHSVAEDKDLTRRLLQAVGVPVPTGYIVTDTEDAWKTAEYIGVPVVVKPGFGVDEKAVAINLTTREQVAAAYNSALEESSTVIVEQHIPGNRYRLLIVGGLMVSAVRREGHAATDVTGRVHPEVASRAVTAARAAGLDIAAVDVITDNISVPLEKQGGSVVDLHAAPKLEPFVVNTEGRVRVGNAIVSQLFPPGENGRIPIAAITGTNGKTTVTRFLAHLLRGTGRRIGMSCTDGIYLDDRRITKGDCSGPQSARNVLMNPMVEMAVCETARGGMLRAGLAFDECEVAVVTNIAGGDHLGIHEVNTPEDLSRVKRLIVEAVSPEGTAVLNAADPLVAAMAEHCRGSVLLFAISPDQPTLAAHRAAGKRAIFVRDGVIVLSEGGKEQELLRADRIPMTFGGRIAFEIENALAAIAAALSMGVDRKVVVEQAVGFAADLERAPTRFNVLENRGATVVVDFGHNPDALRAVIDALDTFPNERRVAVYSSAGDRRESDIVRMGELLGDAFDRVILYEDTDRYKRAPGEITRLMRQGLAKGTRVKKIEEVDGGLNAFRYAWDSVEPGELLLAQAHTADPTVELLRELKKL